MSAPQEHGHVGVPTDPHLGVRATQINHSRRWLAAIIALFLLIGLAYSFVVPAFETPDEPFHYGFARHIAEGNGLPVQSAEQTGPWAQEGSQAPLYYLITGWMTCWIDQDDFAQIAVRNPRANIGDPLDPGNKNFMLYSGRQGPLVGSSLALHIGRWFSLLLGAITLLGVYGTTALLCGGRDKTPSFLKKLGVSSGDEMSKTKTPSFFKKLGVCSGLPLLAAALVAAIPQFQFISASFTNDTLVMAASAATIYWLARLLAKPADQPVRAYEWLVLGVLLGVAALSKLQGLGLVPLAGLAAIFLIWRQAQQSHERERVDTGQQSHDREGVDGSLTLPALTETLRTVLLVALLVGLPLILIAGWWYVRNIQLYGDWSGLGHLTAINGARAEPLALEDFWPEFRGLRFSFWGLFGWFNILLPDWFYMLADALTIAGVLGLIGATVQTVRAAPRPRLDYGPLRVLLLLLAWAGLMFLLLIYWITQATGSQGRLIFPGLIAYGPLLALGLDWWLRLLPARLRLGAWAALLITLLGVSVYSLGWLLPAAYNAPPPVAALPGSAQAVNLRIGDSEGVELVAVEVGPGRYHPGERVPVTLYWRADQPLTHDYQLFIQFLDENGREAANLTSHPGWGRNPTTFWQPGALYADPYQVLVSGPIDEASPLLARVYTGLIDPAGEDRDNLPLPAYTAGDSGGAEVTPFVGAVELAAWRQPSVESAGLQASSATFGDVITLAGHTAPEELSLTSGAPLTVTLLWEASGPPAADYTAYVHLLDANGRQVAGYDQAPAPRRFPTDHWRAGDRILSTFPLTLPADLPPGEYQLWVGLYETASAGALRLPVTEAGGLPAGDGQVEIGRVRGW